MLSILTQLDRTLEPILSWLRDFCRERVDFNLADERRTLPPQMFTEFGRKGLFGLEAPVSEGGLGLKPSQALRLIECAASIDLAMTSMLAIHNFLAVRPLRLCGTSAVQAELLREATRGQRLASFAVTERAAGSDPRRIQTVAQRTEGGWVLNGQKIWIGLSAWSGLLVVLASAVDQSGNRLGTLALSVPSETPGVTQGRESQTLGLRGVIQNEVSFTDVQLSDQHQLGSLSGGRDLIYSSMRFTRIAIAAYCLEILRSALAPALHYARTREVSGGRLVANPFIRAKLSEVVRHIQLLESFLEFVYPRVDYSSDTDELLSLSAKIVAPELLWQDLDFCLQVMGGRGYIEGNRVARMLRDARVIRIFEGPTEAVAQHLGKMIALTGEGFYTRLESLLGSRLTLELRLEFERLFPELSQRSQVREWACVAGQSMAYGIFVLCAAQHRTTQPQTTVLEPLEDFRRQATLLRNQYIQRNAFILTERQLSDFLDLELRDYPRFAPG